MTRELIKKNEENKEVKDINSLFKVLKEDNIKSSLVDDLGNIKFGQNTDGYLTIDYGQGTNVVTNSGFDRLCTLLNVPAKFVRKLPYDNIIKDLTASLMNTQVDHMSFITKDSDIIGVSSRKDPILTLEAVDRSFSSNRLEEIKEIGLENNNLIINFTRDRELLPFSDDTLDIGLSLNHDNTTGGSPSLSLYFWRLICSNGAVARDLVKIVKFSNRLEKSKMLSLLSERITTSLDDAKTILREAIIKMKETKIDPTDRKYIRGYLGRKLNWGENDTSTTQYDLKIGGNNDTNYYDVMNYITDFAKNFDLEEKHRLELLGGRMLDHFRVIKPASEVFPGYSEYKRRFIHKELNG